MYVCPQMRGSGVSDQLMRAILDHATGMVEMIVLTVVTDNLRAIRLYERWGFRIYGTERKSVKLSDNDYLDEHLMARTLRIVE